MYKAVKKQTVIKLNDNDRKILDKCLNCMNLNQHLLQGGEIEYYQDEKSEIAIEKQKGKIREFKNIFY